MHACFRRKQTWGNLRPITNNEMKGKSMTRPLKTQGSLCPLPPSSSERERERESNHFCVFQLATSSLCLSLSHRDSKCWACSLLNSVRSPRPVTAMGQLEHKQSAPVFCFCLIMHLSCRRCFAKLLLH